jgi:hypothetical protein
MCKPLFPATLMLMLLGGAPAVAGSFFGPCYYGLDYYRKYPQRTYLRWCPCRPPWTKVPAETPAPPLATPAADPPPASPASAPPEKLPSPASVAPAADTKHP